jgi:hypothetical protein
MIHIILNCSSSFLYVLDVKKSLFSNILVTVDQLKFVVLLILFNIGISHILPISGCRCLKSTIFQIFENFAERCKVFLKNRNSQALLFYFSAGSLLMFKITA